jgi:hypothetical protein
MPSAVNSILSYCVAKVVGQGAKSPMADLTPPLHMFVDIGVNNMVPEA